MSVQVNCPEDIAPVEGEYQKYKLIKKRLAQMSKSWNTAAAHGQKCHQERALLIGRLLEG